MRAGRERTSSGARNWCGARAPKRQPPPPPGSAFRISSRSVLGGFSQSADAPRRGDYFHCMLAVLFGGGKGEVSHRTLARHLAPSSASLSFSLSLSRTDFLRSRFLVSPPSRYARAVASFSPLVLTRTH